MSVGIYVVQFGFVIGAVVTSSSGQAPAPCCMQNRNSYTMMTLTASLQTGATLPSILDVSVRQETALFVKENVQRFEYDELQTEDFMLLDEDYDAGMQRLQGHLLDQTTGVRQNYTVYNDLKHRRRYHSYNNGTCTTRQLEPIDVLPGPCVPDEFTYAGQYHFRAGSISLPVNIWAGTWQGTLLINYHVAEADCSPIALNFYGNTADASAILLNTYVYADVIQGSVRATDALTLPNACKQSGQVVG